MFNEFTPKIVSNILQHYEELKESSSITSFELMEDVNKTAKKVCSEREKKFFELWKEGLSIKALAGEIGCQKFYVWKLKRIISTKISDELNRG